MNTTIKYAFKNHLPSLLTLASVGCGFASLIHLNDARYVPAMLFMFFAILLDGVDGKVAVLLNSKSASGAMIDSLSDVLSFGLLPGFSIYLFFARVPDPNRLTQTLAWITGIGYSCAGILREVRFLSMQTGRTRTQGFIGLPIAPPAGINVAVLALANLFPGIFYTPLTLGLVFVAVCLHVYLMTASKINYGRWGGRAIALQTLAALLAGGAGYWFLGTLGAFLAVFYIFFCAIYIYSHLVAAGFTASAAGLGHPV